MTISLETVTLSILGVTQKETENQHPAFFWDEKPAYH
jgi:hypothetical protein